MYLIFPNLKKKYLPLTQWLFCKHSFGRIGFQLKELLILLGLHGYTPDVGKKLGQHKDLQLFSWFPVLQVCIQPQS